MLRIHIDTQNGLAVPEGKLKATVEMLVQRIQNNDAVPAIGQNELVYGLRVAVKDKRIEPFEFQLGDALICMNNYGQLDWNMVWAQKEKGVEFPGDMLDKWLSEIF